MSLKENKPETIAELAERLKLIMAAVTAMGGEKVLSDYGKGWYNLAYRTVNALNHIEDMQKASEDACGNESQD